MACLEHQCRDCRASWFDNDLSRLCPDCGSLNTSFWFDEDCDDIDTPEYREEEFDDDENCM
jgi:Zn finger protein HypA/HybF involved in hydrogenase expression